MRYLAVSTLLVNLDSYQGQFAQNYYLYEQNGVFTIIPWDLNMSFAGFSMGSDRDHIIGFMIDEPTCGPLSDRPLIANLLQDQENLEIYHGYLNQLISGPFDPNTMAKAIEEMADLIRDHVAADPTKFFTAEEFEQALNSDLVTDPNAGIGFDPAHDVGPNMGFSSAIGLKAFVRERVANVRNQLNGLAPSRGDGTGNSSGGAIPGGPDPSGWGGSDLLVIESVSPGQARQGDPNVIVTIALGVQPEVVLPPDMLPQRVMIGIIEGRNISWNGLEVTAVFDIPTDELPGMKDISVELPLPGGFSSPGEFPPPGDFSGLPPSGEFPPPGDFGGLPPSGEFQPSDNQGMIFIKTGAFEILADD